MEIISHKFDLNAAGTAFDIAGNIIGDQILFLDPVYKGLAS